MSVRHVLVKIAHGLCLVAVLVLSLLPNDSAAALSTGWDKGNHALAFAVLAFLALHGWSGRVLWLFAGHVGFGVLIEVLQGLVTYRSFDSLDILANIAGLALGAVMYRAVAARMRPVA